jgi:predicted DNA-binding transcriptional regulator AlpA
LSAPARDSRWQPDPLLTVDEVAAWIRKPKATLYAWRSRGLGPPAIRVGNTLRYRRSDIELWLSELSDEPQ